jgi:hypothetical protein
MKRRKQAIYEGGGKLSLLLWFRRRYFFRRRLALADAARCHGLRTVAADAPRTIAKLEEIAASAFSCDIRAYSAAVQVPWAIIIDRRAIVSQEENISSAITRGGGVVLRRRLGVFMQGIPKDLPPDRGKGPGGGGSRYGDYSYLSKVNSVMQFV